MSNKRKLFYIVIAILQLVVISFSLIIFIKIIPDRKAEKERERLVEEYIENKLDLYEEENELYGDYEIEVAFLGDSLTDGYDLEKYYPEFKVVNRGIGGNTTYDLENRLKVSAYDLKPKVIVMLIGANNMDTMFDNYERILEGFKENLPNTKIVLCSLTAMGGEHWGVKNPLACYNNLIIEGYADSYGYEFVDLFTPLFDRTTGEVYEGLTVDGGHFTSEGYELVTAQIKPVLNTLLNK